MKRTSKLALATLVLGLMTAVPSVEAKQKRKSNDPVMRLAYQVEESARYVYRQAERATRRVGPRQAPALRNLKILAVRASSFRSDLGRFGPYSDHVEREYRQLMYAFDRAERSLPRLRVYRRVVDDLHRVDYLLKDLRHEYRARLAHNQRPRDRRYRIRGRANRNGHGNRGYIRIGRDFGAGYVGVNYRFRGDSSDDDSYSGY